MKTRGEMFCTEGMTPLMPDSEICNFITSWVRTKTPQNFAQGSFSVKSLKLWNKNRGEFMTSGPLQVQILY